MLKKLKYKFIFYTMSIFSIIVTVVIGGLYYSVSNQLNERVHDALKKSLDSPLGINIMKTDGLLTFKISNDGSTIIASTYNAEEQIVNFSEIMSVAQESKGDIVFENHHIRYMKNNGYTAFAFITHEIENNQKTLVTAMKIGTIALLFVFISSTVLSSMAMRPVEETWQKQKDFISDASHELRTPVAVILANAAILKDYPNDTIQSKMKWIDYIQDESRRMTELIERLLFLAKNDQTKEKPVFQSLSLSDLVYEVVLPLESVAFEQEKELVLSISEDISIVGEASHLKQLIVILLDNAIKYSPKGEKIRITVTKQGVLSVQNKGDVIPQDKLKRLFERFYRIDDSRQRETHGYGLGLSIADTIAKMHHTKISVTSNEKDGTTFKIDLSKLKG
ncbi:hypothetical protein GMA11_02215 [Granulicatella sp. zg-ZJ]|uniref:sensor histidine kinase n=1 Tax=Granulicatella sp. zg-ZJ TaxID=2678504 RepID=UPI0013D72528|nr:HAMP domain-containing sensor histidine kinase [Granulicatella sp. zg-ZJ]NEW62202.1 hypothetical protein [Granulicatella sp. zg-ZJ]